MMGKFVEDFQALEPIVRGLLANVSRYQTLNQPDEPVFLENHVNILNQQIESVLSVRNELERMRARYLSASIWTPELRRDVLLMGPYLFLPLTSILHISSRDIDWTSSDSRRKNQISFSSKVFKLQAVTARAIQEYVDLSCLVDNSLAGRDATVPNGLISSSSGIPADRLIGVLFALEKSLPSADTLFKQSLSADSLVQVSDTCIASLAAISIICKGHSGNDFSQRFLEASNGTLMIHIVDICAGILVASSPKVKKLCDLCAQSLKAVESIMDTAPNRSAWQFLFPSIFTGLYRISTYAMHENRTGPIVDLLVLSLTVLARLLQLTLKKEEPSKESVDNALFLLPNMNISTKKEKAADPETSEEDQFFEAINSKVRDPLHSLIVSASRNHHTKIRINAILLSRQVLEAQSNIWDDMNLRTMAVESCLALESDTDDAIALAAKSVLNDFKTRYVSESEIVETIIPRIASLLDELLVLVESRNDTQIQAQTNIVTGYLRITSEFEQTRLALRGSRSLNKKLASLAVVERTATVSVPSIHERGSKHLGCYRHMSKRSSAAIDSMLRAYAVALGTKASVLAIDECIADYFESCPFDSESWTIAEGDKWKYDWVGGMMLSREIVLGAFEPLDCMQYGLNDDRKSSKRRRRHLVSLSASLFSAITGSSVWTTALKAEKSLRIVPEVHPARPKLDAFHLQADEVVYCATVDLFTALFSVLGKESNKFLHMVLYTVISGLHHNCSRLVRTVSADALEEISGAVGVHDSSELVKNWFGHLLGKMFEQVHIVGGGVTPRGQDWRNTLATVHMAHTILSATVGSENVLDSSTLSPFVEIMGILIKRIDYFISRNLISEVEVETSLHFYNAVVSRLSSEYNAEAGVTYTYRIADDGKQLERPWEALLERFLVTGSRSSVADETEGLYGPQLAKEENGTRKDLTIPASVLQLTARIVSRSSFLLSHNHLRARILSCDVLTIGFRLFALHSMHGNDDNNQEGIHSNFILEQAAALWPSINARLSISSNEAKSSRYTESISLHVEPKNIPSRAVLDQGMARIFLSKLLGLIAAMCECCGDFMATRFRENVWPILSFQITEMVRVAAFQSQQQQRHQRKPQLVVAATQPISWQGHESERSLLLSSLECISRVFGQIQCGQALAQLVPVVGTVIIPCLDGDIFDEEISHSTVCALKRLAEIDCDALWPRLMLLSGRSMPPNPLMSRRKPTAAHPLSILENSLSKKCLELLGYIDALPEQSFH